MTKDQDDAPESERIGTLIDPLEAVRGTDQYDAFIGQIRSLLAPSESGGDGTVAAAGLAELEQLADSALRTLIEHDTSEHYDGLLPDTFGGVSSAACLIDDRGTLIEANLRGRTHFAMRPGVAANTLDIQFDDTRLVQDVCKDISDEETKSRNVVMRRGMIGASGQQVLCAFARSSNQSGAVLLMLIETLWSEAASRMMRSAFDLSDTESQIADAFIEGVPLKTIAEQRGRSYTTVRNQFQSVLEKSGCPNQTDFLRLASSFFHIGLQLQDFGAPQKMEGERTFEILRPHRRTFDVLMYGDQNGQPIISLPSIFGHPKTPEINRQMQDAGILVIGVARPGFGNTSRPIDKDFAGCFADDVNELMDRLGIARCPFIGRATAARSMFQLTALIPERITGATVVNSLVPPRYIRSSHVASAWTRALMSASGLSPVIASLIVRTGRQLLRSVGPETFLKRMYADSDIDTALAGNREVCRSLVDGVDFVTAQGLEAGTLDLVDGFVDWTADVSRARHKVRLLQGGRDPNVPIAAAEACAGEWPEKIEIVSVPDGGGLLNFTHPREVLNEMRWLLNHETSIAAPAS